MTTVSIIWNRSLTDHSPGTVMMLLATERDLSAYTTIEFEDGFLHPELTREQVCDAMYHATNYQAGPIWDRIETTLPANRSHTSLSIGDQVVVDGHIYTCAEFGWKDNDYIASTLAILRGDA
jgi:hypothetical protein